MDCARYIASRGFFNVKKREIEPHLKPVEGEVRLFRSVLDKALLDLFTEPEGSKLWNDVYDWFFSKECEKDLTLIVNLAFKNVEEVRRGVQHALNDRETFFKQL